jgi:hypothetical protein
MLVRAFTIDLQIARKRLRYVCEYIEGTEPTNSVTKIVLSQPREDSMILVKKNCEPGAEGEEP